MSNVKAETDKVMQFIERNREEISARILIRVIRYLKDALDGATYLVSLTTHRTILGLRLSGNIFHYSFFGPSSSDDGISVEGAATGVDRLLRLRFGSVPPRYTVQFPGAYRISF